MAQVKVFDPKTRQQVIPQNQTVAVADANGVHMLARPTNERDKRYEGLRECRTQRYGVCY